MSPRRIRGGNGKKKKRKKKRRMEPAWRGLGGGESSLLVIKRNDSPNMTINHCRNQSDGRPLLHADNASINI